MAFLRSRFSSPACFVQDDSFRLYEKMTLCGWWRWVGSILLSRCAQPPFGHRQLTPRFSCFALSHAMSTPARIVSPFCDSPFEPSFLVYAHPFLDVYFPSPPPSFLYLFPCAYPYIPVCSLPLYDRHCCVSETEKNASKTHTSVVSSLCNTKCIVCRASSQSRHLRFGTPF